MPIGALDKNRRAGHLHVKTGIDREKRAFRREISLSKVLKISVAIQMRR